MGVSKESIGKFLLGNQFRVELRILSRYPNRRAYAKVYKTWISAGQSKPKSS